MSATSCTQLPFDLVQMSTVRALGGLLQKPLRTLTTTDISGRELYFRLRSWIGSSCKFVHFIDLQHGHNFPRAFMRAIASRLSDNEQYISSSHRVSEAANSFWTRYIAVTWSTD